MSACVLAELTSCKLSLLFYVYLLCEIDYHSLQGPQPIQAKLMSIFCSHLNHYLHLLNVVTIDLLNTAYVSLQTCLNPSLYILECR